MGTLAWILLIVFTVGGAAWYYYRAKLAKKNSRAKIVLTILGGILFLFLFFVVNGILDNIYMPGWFYRFIGEHGDPAGFCLVMIFIAILNFIIPVFFVRSKV